MPNLLLTSVRVDPLLHVLVTWHMAKEIFKTAALYPCSQDYQHLCYLLNWAAV